MAHPADSDQRRVWEDALRLLKVRDRSAMEMAERLRARGHADERVEQALSRLKELKFIDDAALSRRLAERGRRAGQGDRRVKRMLQQRALPDEEVALALAEPADVTESDRLADVARRLMARLHGLPRDTARRRLYGRLARRGFSAEDIHAFLRRWALEGDTQGETDPL